jgi:AmmeMemoRadiSam system protein A
MFVTLHLKGELKGCIGHIEAIDSIYENVIYLVQAAAFEDLRFTPLTKEELEDVNIEISILTVPNKLQGDSNEELIEQIRPGIDGVILLTGYHHATFLPQVWEQLPDRESFLSHLCLKAGLNRTYWQEAPLEFSTYQVECFQEP